MMIDKDGGWKDSGEQKGDGGEVAAVTDENKKQTMDSIRYERKKFNH